MTRPSDATQSSEGNNGSPSSGPDGRLPPAPPQGMQPGILPRPPGPRFAPPPPPGRRLTAAQGVRLGLIWLVIVVLGAAAGLAFTLLQTKLYAAQLPVRYDVSVQEASNNLRTDREMTTQTLLMIGRSVLGPVAQANGIDPNQLAKYTSANIGAGNAPGGAGSNIIMITVLDPDPDVGVRLANAIGQQYLKVADAASPTIYLQQQIEAAQGQLATASGAEAATLASRITTLQGQLDVEHLAGNHASIVAPAYSEPDAGSPNQILAAVTGTFCGIVVACLVAIALSRRWTRG